MGTGNSKGGQLKSPRRGVTRFEYCEGGGSVYPARRKGGYSSDI